MIKNKRIVLICFLLMSVNVFSAKVDTLKVFSPSMDKQISTVVITPEKYSKDKKYPVIYLLHGFSGNDKDWITKVPAIKNYSDAYGFIIVCPDGNFASWYFDSPLIQDSQYETFVTNELIGYIDLNYKTIANKEGRAITGLSMGGHGAFYLAFKHQELYNIAGSMSGALDIKPIADGFAIPQLLGDYARNPEVYKKHSVVDLVYLLNPKSLNIIFSCGVDDFLYKENMKLHESLLYNSIPHVFISEPGSHTWEFWAHSIEVQMNYFNSIFNKTYKISKN